MGLNSPSWTIAELPWDAFDALCVNPHILGIVKAAALVEYNGHDYARYLCNVFDGDAEFQAKAQAWAIEEVQHGEALASWAMKADPDWDFSSAVNRFRRGYQLNVEVEQSVRGSRAGELIARCIVETGTSSFYKALADAVEEPVLKRICQHIEQDELRHYKMFYSHLREHLQRDKISRLQRLRVGLSRIGESEDDELAYAYYAANTTPAIPYHRQRFSFLYLVHATTHYRREHLARMMAMVLKACGLQPHGLLQRILQPIAWLFMRRRLQQARKFLAAYS